VARRECARYATLLAMGIDYASLGERLFRLRGCCVPNGWKLLFGEANSAKLSSRSVQKSRGIFYRGIFYFALTEEFLTQAQRYKCLGNAVTVNVIRAISNRIH